MNGSPRPPRRARAGPQPRSGTLHDQVPDVRPAVAIDLRPVEQVPVDGPAGVSVERVALAVGVPAVAPVPGQHPVDALVDVPIVDGLAQAPADGRHDGREQHPVVGIDVAAVDLGHPREHLALASGSEGRQDALATGPERERQLGGLHDALVAVPDVAPVPGSGRVGAVDEAAHHQVEHIDGSGHRAPAWWGCPARPAMRSTRPTSGRSPPCRGWGWRGRRRAASTMPASRLPGWRARNPIVRRASSAVHASRVRVAPAAVSDHRWIIRHTTLSE